MADYTPLVQARRPGRDGDAAADAERAARHLANAQRRAQIARFALPLLVAAALVFVWEIVARSNQIPHGKLPAPSLVFDTLVQNWGRLASALRFTAGITLSALAAAALAGVLLAMAFAFSKWMEVGLLPIALVLQMTPIVAMAPLVLVWVDSTTAALLLCAWLAALFPVLSHSVAGLNGADPNLRDLYAVYGATRWQRLRWLLVPGALPHFLRGLKIAGGLALVAAVMGEFVAGAAGRHAGLAAHMLESMSRADMPMMLAALLLISLLGIAIFVLTAALARLLPGRWHDGGGRRAPWTHGQAHREQPRRQDAMTP